MSEGPHRLTSWVGSALLASLLATSPLDLSAAGAKSPGGSTGSAAASPAQADEPARRAAAGLPIARYSSDAFRTLPIVFEANRARLTSRYGSFPGERPRYHRYRCCWYWPGLAPSPGTSAWSTRRTAAGRLHAHEPSARSRPRMADWRNCLERSTILSGTTWRWRQNIPTYARPLRGVYPGVDSSTTAPTGGYTTSCSHANPTRSRESRGRLSRGERRWFVLVVLAASCACASRTWPADGAASPSTRATCCRIAGALAGCGCL
jgi:hypothetical protein